MFIADDNILGRLENDEKAFKELVDAYYTPLCVYSVQFTDSLDVSEDLSCVFGRRNFIVQSMAN